MEDIKSYKNIEEYSGKTLPIKSRLEDFVESRRRPKIPESQESDNLPTSISWAASKIYAKDGNERPRERPGSADPGPPARPTPPPWTSVRDSFSATSSPDYI